MSRCLLRLFQLALMPCSELSNERRKRNSHSPDAHLDKRSCNLPRGTKQPRGGLKSNNLCRRKNNFHPRVSTVLLFAVDLLWISCKLNFMAPWYAPRMNFGMDFITQARTSNTSAKSTSSKLANPAVEVRACGTKRTSRLALPLCHCVLGVPSLPHHCCLPHDPSRN